MKCIAIDPGPYMSAVVFVESTAIDGIKIHYSAKDNNSVVMELINSRNLVGWFAAIEQMQSYGSNVGVDTVSACHWSRRFFEAIKRNSECDPILVPRPTIKSYICGVATAKDNNVRAAMIDRFPRTGGGKTPQIGTKLNPGPLYGVTADCWQALALAIYAIEEGRYE